MAFLTKKSGLDFSVFSPEVEQQEIAPRASIRARAEGAVGRMVAQGLRAGQFTLHSYAAPALNFV
jgi:hypothetical protein